MQFVRIPSSKLAALQVNDFKSPSQCYALVKTSVESQKNESLQREIEIFFFISGTDLQLKPEVVLILLSQY